MSLATRMGRFIPVVLLALSVPALTGAPVARADVHPQRTRQSVPCGNVAALVADINAANANGSGTITLPSRCVYSLNAPANPAGANGPIGLPLITGHITIDGSGASIIRGTAAPSFRIAEIAPGGSLSLNDVTVANGSATSNANGDGGGILDRGTLVLTNSRVFGSTAGHLGGGIAVASGAEATLTDSTVWNNTASDGGGIHVGTQATLNATHGEVTANTATYTGGGIASYGTAALTGVAVRKNTTTTFEGGGIWTSQGSLTIEGGDIRCNNAASHGGGIANFGSSLTLSAVVTQNTAASDGGALFNNSGTSQLSSSVITDNRAGKQGGGIFLNAGAVTLAGSRVTGNIPNNCFPPDGIAQCTG